MSERRPRLLASNVFYSPLSFGGATTVAENMCRLLQEQHGWDVVVFTQSKAPHLFPNMLHRYLAGSVEVISAKLANHLSAEDVYRNPEFAAQVDDVIDAIEPDIVHYHCVQDIGAGIVDPVARRGIPLAVTIHDCWWLCERQFMIRPDGRYCHQVKIDPSVCRFCVDDLTSTRARSAYLRQQLDKATRLIFPSDFHRQLHVANGFSEDRCFTNKNGVRMPGPDFSKTPVDDPKVKVRFGFVGGPGPIKGGPQIARAFQDIKRSDYELKIVDAAKHIGLSWRNDDEWKLRGKVTFVDPYTSDTMDEFFAGVDVLLFPSQWKESFGLTVREAMARGIWVIAADAGGLSEDCIDGVNARVIPMSADHTQLTAAILEALDMDHSKVAPSPHVVSIEDQAADLDRQLREMLAAKGRPESAKVQTAEPGHAASLAD